MKAFFDEFKAFAMKGNVIDLAVAVVIGSAFGKIVSSLVDTIVMPLVGVLLGGVDLTDYVITIHEANIAYGVFLQSIVDFLIIALAIFLVIKAMNKAGSLTQEEVAPQEKPTEPTEEVKLLREIRDSLERRVL